MKHKNSGNLYLHITLGSVGIILIAMGIFEFLKIVESTSGYVLTLVGFVITVHYIYYLEKKVGLSNKVIWIRAIIVILILWSIYNFA